MKHKRFVCKPDCEICAYNNMMLDIQEDKRFRFMDKVDIVLRILAVLGFIYLIIRIAIS